MFLIVTPLCKLLLWRVNREIRPTWNATTATKMFCLCRDKPLALYIFSNDKSKVQRMMDSTSSGGFLANDTLVHAGGESFSILQGRGGSSVFEPLVRGGSFNFQQPRGGWAILFYNRNLNTIDTIKNRGNSFQFQRTKNFSSRGLKKYTWLMYSRDGSFMYCKICTRAKKCKGMNKES